MLKDFKDGLKVCQTIKPVPSTKRREPELTVGHQYYVSFFGNNAYPCVLLEVINEFDRTEVKIEIHLKSDSNKNFINSKGIHSKYGTQHNILFATEIGLTPEDAVRNQVN